MNHRCSAIVKVAGCDLKVDPNFFSKGEFYPLRTPARSLIAQRAPSLYLAVLRLMFGR